MFFEPFQYIIGKTRQHDEDEFIPLTIAMNGTQGLIHQENAKLLFLNQSLIDKKIISLSPDGKIVIGMGMNTADEVTAALAEITKHFIQQDVIRNLKKNDELSLVRAAPHWDENPEDDRPWDELKSKTPIYDSRLTAILGLPHFNCHCVGWQLIDGKVTLIFGERVGGFGHGQKDHIGGGKMDADKQRQANMHSELGTESNLLIDYDGKHKPEFFGIIRTAKQHGHKLFQRHIHMFGMRVEGTPTPSAEMAKFHYVTLDNFISHLEDPEKLMQYPYYVPIGVGYFAAQFLKANMEHVDLVLPTGEIIPALSKDQVTMMNAFIREAEKDPEPKGKRRMRFKRKHGLEHHAKATDTKLELS